MCVPLLLVCVLSHPHIHCIICVYYEVRSVCSGLLPHVAEVYASRYVLCLIDVCVWLLLVTTCVYECFAWHTLFFDPFDTIKFCYGDTFVLSITSQTVHEQRPAQQKLTFILKCSVVYTTCFQ